MSKRVVVSLVLLGILGILAVLPDVPKYYFNPEASTPGELTVVFGPRFRYDDFCEWGTSHRWEFGEPSRIDIWASLIIAADLRDHCDSETGVVSTDWTSWIRVGWKPANSRFPVVGYWGNPYARWFGIFNWWGSPIVAVSFPSEARPFLAWWASNFCKNPIQSECRYPPKSESLPSVQAIHPNYPEGYGELWNSDKDKGLKFYPVNPRLLLELIPPHWFAPEELTA